MSATKHLLAVAIRDALLMECQTNIPVDDVTRVDEVVLRKFNGTARLVLVVQHFHPIDRQAWADAIVSSGTQQTDGFRMWPTMDSSGGTNERIRGSVMVSGNLVSTGEEAVDADEIIQEVVARVKWTLRQYRNEFIAIPVDDFGEKIADFQVVAAEEFDSGADTANTSRVFVKWVALTHAKGVTT